MLPNVAPEDRQRAVHQGTFAVRRLADDQLAFLDREPGPARPELGYAGLREIFLHLGDAAEIAVDLGLELAGNLVAAAVRLHPLPEMGVIVVLPGIVEEARVLAERPLHDLLQRLSLPFRA